MSLDYQEIGKRIARCRKRKGLKQAEVEERAEIGQKYLSSIERAISIPSLEVLMRIADVLETTPDEFLVGSARFHDEAWRNVAEKLRGLNEEQLNIADKMIDFIAENL